MTRQDFPGLFRILEYCKGLNWTTQIKIELNLNLQNDTGAELEKHKYPSILDTKEHF